MTAILLPSPIIAQAVKLFAERGYAETNLPSIAKAAKVANAHALGFFNGFFRLGRSEEHTSELQSQR